MGKACIMASQKYLREKFQRLQTDQERDMFCLNTVSQELWSRDWQDDMIPEGFKLKALNNLQAALADVGRSDLWERFGKAMDRLIKNQRDGIPDAEAIFVREAAGLPADFGR
jgi:hypothetical protein